MRRRVVASFALALAVFAGFLYFVGPRRVATDLAGVRPTWALAAVLLGPGAFLAWSESLRQLHLEAGTDVPRGRFRLAFASGVFAKQVLPVGNASGPAFIAYAVNTESDNRYEHDLAVATVGELFNLAASFVVGAAGIVALLATGRVAVELLPVGVALAVAAAVVAGLLVLLFVRRALLDGLLHRFARLVGTTVGRLSARVAAATAPARVDTWLDGFGRPLSAIADDRRAVVGGLAYSLLGWICLGLAMYASAVALGNRIPLVLALFVVPVGGFASIVPLPGGVGGVEAAMAGLLAAFGDVELVGATATVLLFRLVSFWLVLAAGGLATAYLSIDVEEMSRGPLDV